MKCVIIDDDQIQVDILTKLIENTETLELVKTYNDPVNAAKTIKKCDADLLFLDIEMPDINGIEFLENINFDGQVILISAHDKFAMKAFDLSVSDYLLKPVSYARFHKAINKVEGDKSTPARSNNEHNKEIFVKVNTTLKNVNIDDILFVEASRDYVILNLKGEEKIKANSSMKNIESKLPPNEFVRVHRSFIVRVKSIERIDGDILEIDNRLISVSKSYKSDLMKSLNLL